MTSPQSAPYTPRPVTQRDGSALANSNCRMASIATGIDYQTEGAQTSSGSRMRSYCSDQSGGTDSSDAVQSWRSGYGELLEVRDGYTFDNALQDLGRGSAVHLDVWHAACGSAPGICRSGSGAYGHTMYVHPDYSSAGWLVADPWCSPPKLARVPEAQLRAGAEEWGRTVYGSAVLEADYPTGGTGRIGDPRHEVALAIARRVARELMTRAHPELEELEEPPPTPRDWGETGGGKPVLFTRTRAIAEVDMPGIPLVDHEPLKGTVTVRDIAGVLAIQVSDREPFDMPPGSSKPVVGRALILDDSLGPDTPTSDRHTVYVIGGVDVEDAVILAEQVDYDPDPGEGEDAYERGRADEWETWAAGMGIPPKP